MKVLIPFAFMALILLTDSCCVSKQKAKQNPTGAKVTSGQAIIYTTRKDYSNLVPVILTSDKKGIASYPDIKDIFYKGSLAYPTPLHKGFLLDNRGISQDVAFIKLTYEQYAALPVTPSAEELMNMLVDKNPLTKMYACGLRGKFVNITEEINALIDSENYSGFTRLK